MGTLTTKEARHLLARVGLGVRLEEVNRYYGGSREASVRHAVYSSAKWDLPPPRITPWRPWSKQTIQQRNHAQQRLMLDKQAVKHWQIEMLLRTPYPLTERMVLFWHNWFTTSMDRVNQPELLIQQNRLFRHHALGNFKQFLHGLIRDPAMLIYLDNNTNNKDQTNENFARELLELFTVGEGNFRESDMHAAKLALTGWSVDRRTGRFVFHKHLHDNSMKFFMGKKGNFNGDDIINILLQNPRTAQNIAERIARKFWAEFVSDEKPNPATIRRWGIVFRHAKYDIRTLLITVLNSPEFWSPRNRGEKAKSPIELVVGTLRSLHLKSAMTPPQIIDVCTTLGQPLFNPETPEGYRSGRAWITPYTLPIRVNLMSTLVANTNSHDLAYLPVLSEKQAINWLLARKPTKALPTQPIDIKTLIHELVTDRAYQLT